MTAKTSRPVFRTDLPPDLEHAAMIREEALDWLENQFPGTHSFSTGDLLQMAGEQGRRWLISRLRANDIANESEVDLSATADGLTVLFLRSRGVKFREAVAAVVGREPVTRGVELRYGGLWNRLLVTALDHLRRRIPSRLLGSALFSVIQDPVDQPNCLLIVRRLGLGGGTRNQGEIKAASHDYVYRAVVERPAPACTVVSPSREVIFLAADRMPTRAEVTSRRFIGLEVATRRETYELLIGTIRPVPLPVDSVGLLFLGRLLDLVFLDFEEFYRAQGNSRLETAAEPEPGSADDLPLWLMTQFLDHAYQGSLSEISEMPTDSPVGRVLANSAAKPWEPSPWDPPKSLDFISGYSSNTGVPLVIEKVEYPWTTVIGSVDSEMRYLRSRNHEAGSTAAISALALPFVSTSGDARGSLYMLLPQMTQEQLAVEVRVLAIFSRIIGEIIERQRAARHSAEVFANVSASVVLNQEQFRSAILDLLERKAASHLEPSEVEHDMRLPFLLLSAHRPDIDEPDPGGADRLKGWLVQTLRHLEWRSFIRTHLGDEARVSGTEGFVGELPGAGVVIALDRFVTKSQLDKIRSAFPATINRIRPTNSPVRLVAWVLDVPAQRIWDAAEKKELPKLADDVERWAFDVATVVDDVAQSTTLANEQGEWDAALRSVRRALRTDSGKKNGYLYRLAAHCSFSVGDWPSALRYAQEGARMSRDELGSGFVRSVCQEADGHICLCDPVRAWDLYTSAAETSPRHPLPRYYRGQGVLLMARLLEVYQRESSGEAIASGSAGDVLDALVNRATDDLTVAADLLDRWGLIPESYQYRNFYLVPTLMGQGLGYLLTGAPGTTASRLQSARKSFPKDDLFYREYIFAKCWEQGLHRKYGELLLSDGWEPLRDRLRNEFGGR